MFKMVELTVPPVSCFFALLPYIFSCMLATNALMMQILELMAQPSRKLLLTPTTSRNQRHQAKHPVFCCCKPGASTSALSECPSKRRSMRLSCSEGVPPSTPIVPGQGEHKRTFLFVFPSTRDGLWTENLQRIFVFL